VYEFSVQHNRVRVRDGYVRAEILLMAYVAEPVPGDAKCSRVTVINQTDMKCKMPAWLAAKLAEGVLVKTAGAVDAAARKLTPVDESVFGEVPMDPDMDGEDDDLMAMMDDVPGVDEGDDGDGAKDGESRGLAKVTRPSLERLEREMSMSPVGIHDFKLLAVLGRGGYGKVLLVQLRRSGETYAMKVLRKKQLVQKQQVERTKLERKILANINHPFIVRLHYSFQNKHKLYMVMDFVQGGDLFTHLVSSGCFSELRAQLYVAEMVLALEHLHKRGVVYRDLKPENVLLDAEGHIKLVDFGLSHVFDRAKQTLQQYQAQEAATAATSGASDSEDTTEVHNLTHSFCGTEQYMAPEVLLQKGHGKAVDFWCLGILMSEMITGRHPFRTPGASRYKTLRNVVDPSVPPRLHPALSPSVAALIRAFLHRDPAKRLGGGTDPEYGMAALRNHPFFAGLDWAAVTRREVKPQFIPELKSAKDIRHFDKQFTREAAADSAVLSTVVGEKPDGKADPDFSGFSYTAPGADVPGESSSVVMTPSMPVPRQAVGSLPVLPESATESASIHEEKMADVVADAGEAVEAKAEEAKEGGVEDTP
jgi:serine/threonine protein kinase